jgi:cell shape-determining protein MreC
MDHETEVIKQQMLETRTSLTEKLQALEEQVASTVRSTTEAVTETAEAVKGAVENTVSAVKGTVEETVETVKSSFDLTHQMEAHPWLMLGGAVVAGYFAASLLNRGASAVSSGVSHLTSSYTPPPQQAMSSLSSSGRSPSSSENWSNGLWDTVTRAFQPAISRLEELAIGAAAGVVSNMVVNAAPEALRTELKPIFDDLIRSLGGKNVNAQQLWDNLTQAHQQTGRQDQQRHDQQRPGYR